MLHLQFGHAILVPLTAAVAIALALSLSVDIPHWYAIQSMVYGVALFSLVIQAPIFSFLSQRKLQSEPARSVKPASWTPPE